MTKLSDTQAIILSGAGRHPALLASAPKLPAAVRQAVFRSMLKNLLLEEVPAPAEHRDLAWRQDEDGRALSPTHCRSGGRLYRYYVALRVLKGEDQDDGIVRRVSAAPIEAAVIDQVRALLRQPEIVAGTWLAARDREPRITEQEVRQALVGLDPLWGEVFPAEQARIVRALVDRVVVGPEGADIRLRVEGLAGLVRELTAIPPEALRSAP